MGEVAGVVQMHQPPVNGNGYVCAGPPAPVRFSFLLALLAGAVPSGVAASASAQPMWRPALDGPSVSLDVLTGLGDDYDSEFYDDQGQIVGTETVSVTSMAFVVGARVPVGPWVFVADLPFSYAGVSAPAVGRLPGGSEDDLTVGNPYLGAETAVRPGLAVGGGVRLPLFHYEEDGAVAAGRFGEVGGLTADPERFQAYQPGVLTLSAEARYTARVGPARLRVRLAPSYLAEVSDIRIDGDPDRNGLALGYSVLADIGVRSATVSGGVFGQPVVGEWFSLFSIGATAAAGVSVPIGPVRPGLAVRVPLDSNDLFYKTDATVGLSLDVPIR